MKLQHLKKGVAGAMMALVLLLGSGVILETTAQAQWRRDNDRYRDRDDNRYRGNDRDWYRRQQIERAREEARRREQARREWEWRRQQEARNRSYRNYPNGSYGSYGNYGNYGGYGGYSSAEEQRGYRNGLKEGGDDARDRDSFNPSRHSSFRDGNPAYRRGFARGYEQSYRQYAGYRRY
jgi:hypothetical protein